MTKQKNLPLRFSLFALGGALCIFALVRGALFLQNQDFFSVLSTKEVLLSFWYGLRFDLSIIGLFMGPVLVLMNLPIPKKGWLKFWTSILMVEAVLMTGFLIGDLVYFPKVNRHMAEELVQLSNDWGFIAQYMLEKEWLPTLILLVAFVGILWAIGRYINRHYTPIKRAWWKEVLIGLVGVALCFLAIRGKVTGKPLGVADVYNFTSSVPGAALTLNGLFSSYQVARKGAIGIDNSYPVQQAIERTQELFIAKDEEIPSGEYPLMRRRKSTGVQTSSPNVFILLLEGWHPYYIDSFSHHNFGVTPEFDNIVKGGVAFTNAYAAGQRSIVGFGAVLAGIPQVPGLALFGYGLEMSSLTPMPKFFAEKGYYTFFAQTSLRDSFRLGSLAAYLGMQESYGWEDMPRLLTYNQKAPFGYDYEALMFAADKIKNRPSGKPFFSMVFTGITHEPFTSTLPQFDKYPYDTLEHGMLNTLGYADWSIGRLIEKAKEDGWFDDTIFVFVADHSTSIRRNDTELRNQFQIPLVLYSPKYLRPKQVDKVVSQMDIMPTLLKLANINVAYSALGQDLLDDAQHVAFVSTGVNIGLVRDEGAVRVGGGKILAADAFIPPLFDEKKVQGDLFAIEKAIYSLLKQNRWYLPEDQTHE